MGEGCQGMGEEVRKLKSTNWLLQNSREDIKYSIGNGEAKEYICMTHGHGRQCGDCLRGKVGGAEWSGAKEEKLGKL